MQRYVRLLILLVAAAAFGVPLALAWPYVVGYEGTGDVITIAPHELANQVTDITKYMQGLATSVLGLIGFLLSQRVSTYWNRLSPPRRAVVIAGALLCGLSICVGLIQYWVILSLSADGAVRSGLDRVVLLSIIQAAQLGLGVLMIGYTALAAIGAPSPSTPSELQEQGVGGQQ